MSAPAPSGVADLIADVRSGVGDVAGAVDDILAAARAALELLTAPVPPGIPGLVDLPAALDRLRRLVTDVIAQIEQVLAYAGDPDALRAAARAWSAEIGGAAGRLAGVMTLDGMRADDHWVGIAADAYKNTLPPQKDALVAVKTAGDELDSVLNDIANAIFVFWVTLAADLITLEVALVAAAATAATVVGAPVGVTVAVGALTTFSAFLIATVKSLLDISQGCAARSAVLQRRVTNDVAFPRGAWPRSTADLGDGSITDGDDTDWHLR